MQVECVSAALHEDPCVHTHTSARKHRHTHTYTCTHTGIIYLHIYELFFYLFFRSLFMKANCCFCAHICNSMVSRHVCRHAHVEVQCTCLCAWRAQDLTLEVSCNHSPPYVFMHCLSTESRANMTSAAGQLAQGNLCLSLPLESQVGYHSHLPSV